MRRLSVILTTALLTTLLATLIGPATQAASKKPSSVSVRLAPDRITIYPQGMVERTGVVAQVTPATKGRSIRFQRLDGATWTTLGNATTDRTGRAYLPLDVTTVGSTRYRAVLASNAGYRGRTSSDVGLTAYSNASCRPNPAPVDPAATGEATCLLARLDRWRSNGLMAVGQQLNVSSKESWDRPLAGIGRPSVIGFDLEELDQAATTAFPYDAQNRAGLLDLAHQGALLVASWHATNPFTGETFQSARRDLRPLLSPGNDAYDRFWDDWATMLDHLKRFEIGDGDGDGVGDGPNFNDFRTAVVVRPLHEVNGDFFWWGKPDPRTYKTLFAMMQARAAAWNDPHDLFDDSVGTGVHNIVWAYSGNRKTSTTSDPGIYRPSRIDVGGLDTYDPEFGTQNAADRLGLEGYRQVASAGSPPVSRMALTEVGPHGSKDGAWNPSVISRAVRTARVAPLWAMLWFDDGTPTKANPSVGKKQLGSLNGGSSWLRSCYNGLCYLR